VLTWFQISNGAGGGEGVIYNARYQQIATVTPANGYAVDFLITPWNTALILADRPGTADVTSLGLSAHQPVNDGVVQEIDIKTGKLLFHGTAPTTYPTATATRRCRSRASHGTGSTSTPSTSRPTATC
jgi:hypothetical protein